MKLCFVLVYVVYHTQIVSSIVDKGLRKCTDYFKDFSASKNEVELKDKRFLKHNGLEQPIRIHFDFTGIDFFDKYKQDYKVFRDNVFPRVSEIFKGLIKVKNPSKRLRFSSKKCVNVLIPEKFSNEGEGIDADLVVFVRLDDTGYFKENKIEAASTHCIVHKENNRPLAGVILFRPNLLSSEEKFTQNEIDYLIWLAIHETTHILGFSSKLYELFIDSEGKVIGYDKVISTGKYNNKNINYIITPKVLEVARAHFNCTNLKGVPLEYHGGDGSAESHWSKKFTNTEYMIADSYSEHHISDLTLALLEDSGWYIPDYSKSNNYLWGKGKGCEFFNETFPCVKENPHLPTQNYLESKPYHFISNFENEFCNSFNTDTCSITHQFKAKCVGKLFDQQLKTYESYFSNNKLGSTDWLTDRCPIPSEMNKDVFKSAYRDNCKYERTERTKNPSFLNSMLPEERFCSDCICVVNSITKKEKEDIGKSGYTEEISEESFIAGCYKKECIDEKLYLIFEHQGNISKVQCTNADSVKVEGFKGTVKCPDPKIICHKKSSCTFGC